WLNIFGWLTRETRLATPEPYLKWRGPRFLAYERPGLASFGSDDRNGYYNLFAALGRASWVFANEDLSVPAAAILFAHDGYYLPKSTLSALVGHLRGRRPVYILGDLHLRGGESVLAQLRYSLGEPAMEENEG